MLDGFRVCGILKKQTTYRRPLLSAFLTMTASDPLMVGFQSMAPHNTKWIAINFNVNDHPDQLLAAFEAYGWKTTSAGSLAPLLPPSPVNDRMQIELFKDGTGLFGGWTPTEKRKFVKEAKAIMVANGVEEYYDQKLTYADLV